MYSKIIALTVPHPGHVVWICTPRDPSQNMKIRDPAMCSTLFSHSVLSAGPFSLGTCSPPPVVSCVLLPLEPSGVLQDSQVWSNRDVVCLTETSLSHDVPNFPVLLPGYCFLHSNELIPTQAVLSRLVTIVCPSIEEPRPNNRLTHNPNSPDSHRPPKRGGSSSVHLVNIPLPFLHS